jgi:hypothetical protein
MRYYFWLAAILAVSEAFAAETVPEPARDAIAKYISQVDEARNRHAEAAQTALKKWNDRLDELIEVARAKGNLDAVLALQAQRQGTEPATARGPAKRSGEAVAARKAHEEAMRKADQEFRRTVDIAHSKLLGELDSIEKSETIANRIEGAVAVRELRRAKEREGPPDVVKAAAAQTGPSVFADWNAAWDGAARLVREQAVAAGDRPISLVWLIDASISLAPVRKDLADRIAGFQSSVAGPAGVDHRTVSTGVAVFGQGFATAIFPSNEDASLAANSVRGIPIDSSGKEQLCAAVIALSGKIASSKKGEQVIVLIVTDERGDDLKSLEDAIRAARNTEAILFAVCAESPFGVAKGRAQVTFDDNQTTWLPLDSGPETALPEFAQFPSWGDPKPEFEAGISSGFGPYSLGRLCEATTGRCLAVEMPTFQHPKTEVMQRYRPDYRSAKECEADIKSNKAKSVVGQLAAEWLTKPPTVPPLVFPLEKGGTKPGRTRALREADEWLRRLDKVLSAFREAEPDRRLLRESRWRAAFDWHRGQLLVMRARVVDYRRILTESMTEPGLVKSPNRKLVRSKTDWSSADARSARDLLEPLVTDHAGTPWAFLAERALGEDLGWAWEPIPAGAP